MQCTRTRAHVFACGAMVRLQLVYISGLAGPPGPAGRRRHGAGASALPRHLPRLEGTPRQPDRPRAATFHWPGEDLAGCDSRNPADGVREAARRADRNCRFASIANPAQGRPRTPPGLEAPRAAGEPFRAGHRPRAPGQKRSETAATELLTSKDAQGNVWGM